MNESQQLGAAIPLNQTFQNSSKCQTISFSPHIVPSLYLLMFPLALVLNGVAAWVSLHLQATSTFVVYLKNLVAADLIMTLIIPIKAAIELAGPSNTLSVLECKFVSVFFYSTLYTCIALLGFIGLDRFFKIMMPRNKLFSQNLMLSRVVSALIWILMFGVTGLPNSILTNYTTANMTQVTSCMELKGPAGIVYHEKIVLFMNVFFLIVSIVITFCYICITNKVIQSFRNSGSNNNQGQQKIKLRVFLVVIIFFVSFAPYHIIRIPYTSMQVQQSSQSCSFAKIKFAKDLSFWFASINICMDPLLYVFLCREFKEKLMSLMEKCLSHSK